MIETALLANWISLTLLWLISLRMKDSSIIDIYWGFGFVLICWASFHNQPAMNWFWSKTSMRRFHKLRTSFPRTPQLGTKG